MDLDLELILKETNDIFIKGDIVIDLDKANNLISLVVSHSKELIDRNNISSVFFLLIEEDDLRIYNRMDLKDFAFSCKFIENDKFVISEGLYLRIYEYHISPESKRMDFNKISVTNINSLPKTVRVFEGFKVVVEDHYKGVSVYEFKDSMLNYIGRDNDILNVAEVLYGKETLIMMDSDENLIISKLDVNSENESDKQKFLVSPIVFF